MCVTRNFYISLFGVIISPYVVDFPVQKRESVIFIGGEEKCAKITQLIKKVKECGRSSRLILLQIPTSSSISSFERLFGFWNFPNFNAPEHYYMIQYNLLLTICRLVQTDNNGEITKIVTFPHFVKPVRNEKSCACRWILLKRAKLYKSHAYSKREN